MPRPRGPDQLQRSQRDRRASDEKDDENERFLAQHPVGQAADADDQWLVTFETHRRTGGRFAVRRLKIRCVDTRRHHPDFDGSGGCAGRARRR